MADDPTGAPAVELAPLERRLLERLRAAELAVAEEALLDDPPREAPEAVRGALQRLRSKHLAESDEEPVERPRLTARGEATARDGLPERRLWEALWTSPGPIGPEEIARLGFTDEERSAAIGVLRRQHRVGPGMPLAPSGGPSDPAPAFPEETALRELAGGERPRDPEALKALRRRGLAEIERAVRRSWRASPEGRRVPLADGSGGLGALTGEILREESWRHATFRAYDVRAPVPRWSGARPHPYVRWLEEFEEILVGLGFSGMEGPLVESEFWNADVLFMPQDHPARSIHDVLSIADLAPSGPPAELLERVAAAHEGRPLPGEPRAISAGWRAPYDRALARRPVLRSQTTSVSARFLASHPRAPFRKYSLDRNFRRDAVDATHHVEFCQCEGILGAEGTNLRELIGVFGALAEAIGVRELKFRPSYFPFTEPSIEGYVRHPRLGWIEVFPGGLFRPEVLRPLGIDVPVAAWGIGVTRLAMVALGVSDIRELFVDDLERLRRGGV